MSDGNITVILSDKEEKKHSVRYNSESRKLLSIYVPKQALSDAFNEYPDKIKVTITKED